MKLGLESRPGGNGKLQAEKLGLESRPGGNGKLQAEKLGLESRPSGKRMLQAEKLSFYIEGGLPTTGSPPSVNAALPTEAHQQFSCAAPR
ncbi:hypothetical protein [Paenibacillus sp. NPDC057967]|uniref:hypothetical protein n=1 Tax=Paenibacillus sp. NPDC057967 TaxID=3346293 RepID=UPI0036D8F12C